MGYDGGGPRDVLLEVVQRRGWHRTPVKIKERNVRNGLLPADCLQDSYSAGTASGSS
jgi:hypothetical protein